jgi:hypothetical protein
MRKEEASGDLITHTKNSVGGPGMDINQENLSMKDE